MFLYGRVRVFSISVLSEPGAQHSSCLFLVTFIALDTVYHPTLFILRAHQQGPYGVERFVVRWYTMGSEYPLELFRQPRDVGDAHRVLVGSRTFCWVVLFPNLLGDLKRPLLLSVPCQNFLYVVHLLSHMLRFRHNCFNSM